MTVTASTRVVAGTCHHDCPDSCGWHITVADGVAVKIRGNRDHPFSAGELCPKVNRLLDRVYSPDRILTPLRRTGPKGSGQFEPVSWDEALAETAANLHRVVDTYGGEAVLPFSSAGNQSVLAQMGLNPRFFAKLGASRLQAGLCGPTVAAGVRVTNGTAKSLDPMELAHSKLIVLWGTNTKLTNRHLWPTIEKARANGARVVVIDPMRTATAQAADWFIQPLPGTDIALMLAMMHVLIRDGLVDRDWVDAHTLGFDELATHVADWTPERAGVATGLDVGTITAFAREYGTTRPVAIRCLIGAEHHTNGAMHYRTLAVLPALVGAWRDRGGGYSRSVGIWQDELIDEPYLLDTAGIESISRGPHGFDRRVISMNRLGDVLTDAALAPGIHALFVWGANPVVTVPHATLIRRGMARDDLFTVVHEQFLTDTARYADVIFPATTQIEAPDVVQSWGHLWMGWNEPAIAPRGEACSNTELFRRLAAAMGFDDPALLESDESLFANAVGRRVDLAELRDVGWVRAPYPDDGRPFGDGVFPTASGKVEFVSPQLAAFGQPALPTYIPPVEGPQGDPELLARYPLQLLSAKFHTRFHNSGYSHLPKHGPAEGAPFVELSPADAAARGLVAGDVAEVFNDRGSLELAVRIGDLGRDGVVIVPWGWWGNQHRDGKAVNSITNDTLTDWGGGVAYFDTLVEIRKLSSPEG